MKKILTISLLSSVMLLAGFKVGDNFPTLTLDDQFKKTTTITKDTKANHPDRQRETQQRYKNQSHASVTK